LPTNEKKKTVIVNGKEEAPIRKTALPLHVDWQEIAAQKTEEREEAEATAREEEAKK